MRVVTGGTKFLGWGGAKHHKNDERFKVLGYISSGIVIGSHWGCCPVAQNSLGGGGEGRKEIFYLTRHSTHFIYGYMASDIWLRTILIVREETRCRHIGYSFRLTARVLLYAPSHRQDSTYHGLCYGNLLHESWSTGWNEK